MTAGVSKTPKFIIFNKEYPRADRESYGDGTGTDIPRY